MPHYAAHFRDFGQATLIGCFICVGLVTQSGASTIQTLTVELEAPEDGDVTLIVPQFDQGLGDLTALELFMAGTATKSSSASGISTCFGTTTPPICSTQFVTAIAVVSLDIVMPLLSLKASNTAAMVDSCRSPNEPGGTCTATAVASVSVGRAWSFDSQSVLNAWLNQDPLTVLFDTDDGATVSVAEATVTYTYTPAPAAVPVPAGIATMLGGLASLVMAHRSNILSARATGDTQT
ncbi:MAG: hypothetical protein AAGF71_12260 [Pseudomonadota bacterium]